MKIKLLAICCAFLLLCACSPVSAGDTEPEGGGLSIVATTYPLWVFCENLLSGVDGITLELMIDQQISCVHDYSLSVSDMLLLEKAGLLIMNGAGFEAFLEDALGGYPSLPRCDSSQGVKLICSEDGHAEALGEHSHEDDPHIWLDPQNAMIMCGNIAAALIEYLPEDEALILENLALYTAALQELEDELTELLSTLSCRELITFHDGFLCFAAAFDLEILRAVEEEAGSEASAGEISDIIDLIQTRSLPAIFTETNGSQATAQAIARETGCSVGVLDMIISGEKSAQGYANAMRQNARALIAALSAV